MEAKIKNKKRIKIIANGLSILIVVVVLIWAVVSFFQLGEKGYTNDAQVEEFINPVSSRISGYVSEIRYREHQAVKSGDTLVILDRREFMIQREQALSNLLEAQSGSAVVSAGLNTAQNNILVAKSNLAELKARLDNAEDNLKRYGNLLEKDAVTKYQYDQVKTEQLALQAKYNSLIGQDKSSQLTSAEAGQRVGVSAATLKRAQAQLDMADLNLSYTIITAPYDGTMGRMLLQEGQLIQASQAIGTIVKGDEKWITANYKERDAAKLIVGERVNIRVDALAGLKLSGTITAISAATGAKYSNIPIDNSAGNFVKVEQRIPVRIDFDKGTEPTIKNLRAGMNVEVNLIQ